MNFSGTISSDFMKLSNIPVSKRPSLINFAATDFVSLRNSLIDYAKAVYPDDYKYFVESDLGLMFLEEHPEVATLKSMYSQALKIKCLSFPFICRQVKSIFLHQLLKL